MGRVTSKPDLAAVGKRNNYDAGADLPASSLPWYTQTGTAEEGGGDSDFEH